MASDVERRLIDCERQLAELLSARQLLTIAQTLQAAMITVQSAPSNQWRQRR